MNNQNNMTVPGTKEIKIIPKSHHKYIQSQLDELGVAREWHDAPILHKRHRVTSLPRRSSHTTGLPITYSWRSVDANWKWRTHAIAKATHRAMASCARRPSRIAHASRDGPCLGRPARKWQ